MQLAPLWERGGTGTWRPEHRPGVSSPGSRRGCLGTFHIHKQPPQWPLGTGPSTLFLPSTSFTGRGIFQREQWAPGRLREPAVFGPGEWGCSRKLSQPLLPALPGLLRADIASQRKSELVPLWRPAVASRAIYFSVPKPLSHLFTQGGKEVGLYVPAWALSPTAWGLVD